MTNKILLLTYILIYLLSWTDAAYGKSPIIGMLIEKENTATYIETLEGFKKELSDSGKQYAFVEKNAMKNKKTMEVIARNFSSDPTIKSVVVLGSAASRIAHRIVKNKPVVLGGINHPEGLGISGDNITGTTYYIDPSTVVNLIMKLRPDVRRVGILYEPPEQNAASIVEVPETESAFKKQGIDIVKETVENKMDIVNKTKYIIEKDVQYLIIPTNRLLYSNVSLIRSVTDKVAVPIVSFSRKGVYNGAMIAITSNNHKLGKKMAEMLIDIMDGSKSPSDIQWYFPQKYTIIINEESMDRVSIKIPHQIFEIATIIKSDSSEREQKNEHGTHSPMREMR